MGSVYKRGNIYWVKFYKAGRCFRESSHSQKITEAKRLLKIRDGQVTTGHFLDLQPERTRFKALSS